MKPANTSRIVRATQVLLVVFVVGFGLLVAINVSFQHLAGKLDREVENQQVHRFISEQMVLAAKQAELLVYQMPPAATEEAYLQNLKEVDELAGRMSGYMAVMLHGGSVREALNPLTGSPQTAVRDLIYKPGADLRSMDGMGEKVESLMSRLRADTREVVARLRERDRCQQQQLSCAPQAVARVRELYRELPLLFGALQTMVRGHQSQVSEKVGKLEVDIRGRREYLEWLRKASALVVALLFLGFTLAISRRIRVTEQQLVKATAAAASASSEKSRFLASMSHDIRTPLNGVIGFSQLLQDTQLDPEQREYVLNLSNSANSLLLLVNDVLDLSRIEAGGVELEMRPFVVADLARSVASVFATQVRKTGVALEVDVAPAAEGSFVGDSARLRRVLQNLVGNAVKFTERGEVRIAVSEVSQGLRFEVRDTGIGIAPADQQRIFQAYRQAEASTLRKYGGTGLGLAICHGLVVAMGGTIGIDSQPGAGSCFWFELPMVRGVQSEPGAAPATPWLLPSGFQNLEDVADAAGAAPAVAGRVLVVDDSPTDQTVAATLLRKMGHGVDVVGSAEQAIDAVQRNAYDIVFMDLRMPGLDGLEAARRIRSLAHACAKVCIMAMTANAMKSDRDACLAAGMDGFISKPVTAQRLSECMARRLEPPSVG